MKRIVAALAAVVVASLVFTGCGYSQEYTDRKEKQSTIVKGESLGKKNQEERLEREENANAIRYVYLMSFGNIIGYYVIQGKVSPAGTQLSPEQEIICRSTAESCQAVDSAKDDGTYGDSDSGSFFFTTEGVLIETTLDYIQSDAPIALDVPRFNQ